MFRFEKTVAYHETDKMGITHHSNYVKWMEEARVAFLEDVGLSYSASEKKGIVSPVTSISVTYKKPSTFGDKIFVEVSVLKYSGASLDFQYKITNALSGDLVALATSSHCFLKNGKVLSLKKSEPDMHSLLETLLQ